MRHVTVSIISFFAALILVIQAIPAEHGVPAYLWLKQQKRDYDPSQSIERRIPVPSGYRRETSENFFQQWLRRLPLKQGKPPVRLYNGTRKPNQTAHHAVIDIDVGRKNLQQCADAVIRLRAEFLYSIHDFPVIHFNFTSGDRIDWTRWSRGERPMVRGNKVQWKQSGKTGISYPNFRHYLDTIFMYAGTLSLSKELKPVRNVEEMEIGDVFIQGGTPGHAVIVLDMAAKRDTGKKLFLLGQSYMPAQDIHVLKNPDSDTLSPWYPVDFGQTLHIPEWTFSKNNLMRFKNK